MYEEPGSLICRAGAGRVRMRQGRLFPSERIAELRAPARFPTHTCWELHRSRSRGAGTQTRAGSVRVALKAWGPALGVAARVLCPHT